MGFDARNFETDAAVSFLGWWHDVGVDTVISEAPHDWLGTTAAIKTATPDTIAVSASPLSQTLAALVTHLMTADIADAGPANRRVPPSGKSTSELMILTDYPDAPDVAAGELLSDPVFAKMLEAIGHDRSSVYVASLCPGRPVTGRLSDEVVTKLAVLAKQHIAHVAPKQLWLVGSAASRAILGVDDATARGKLHKVNHLGIITDAIATAHPRMFEGSKSRKAAAWAEMQRLSPRTNA